MIPTLTLLINRGGNLWIQESAFSIYGEVIRQERRGTILHVKCSPDGILSLEGATHELTHQGHPPRGPD
jgi:hypothetical protein